MKTPHINDLMKFLDTSPTSYQAAENIEQTLLGKGFTKLDETASWKLKAGGKFFVLRDQSAVVAFVMGKKKPHLSGFRLAASHLDSPALKIKPDGIKQERNNIKLTVELYGGPIISTWLDRELSIAGRVIVKSKSGKPENRLLNLNRPIVIIPNAAIHLNREVNKGFEYNAQNHLQAILQATEKDGKPKTLRDILASELKVKATDIADFDLFLFDPNPAVRIGAEQEMLVNGRLDNLAMSHAILSAFHAADRQDFTSIAIFYDHEEIGSLTPQGANSSFTEDILHRICWASQLNQEEAMIAFRKSFLVSADMAHAVHPNFPEKHDPAYIPLLNHGPVIKMNGSQRYATTAESCSRFENICLAANVPVQKIINRSDLVSGSTIGPTAASKLGMATVDIGNPMWAMHSIRETMGVYDHEFLIRALRHYYELG